jgi:hypothetical protein
MESSLHPFVLFVLSDMSTDQTGYLDLAQSTRTNALQPL